MTVKAGDTDDSGGAAGAACGDESGGIIGCTPILSSTIARCRTQGELFELTSKSVSLPTDAAVSSTDAAELEPSPDAKLVSSPRFCRAIRSVSVVSRDRFCPCVVSLSPARLGWVRVF